MKISDINNPDFARQILSMSIANGTELEFTNERLWVEVTEGQLNASAPSFITEESGSLKTHIYNQEINGRFFILVNAVGTDKNIKYGDPNWIGSAIDTSIVAEYVNHYLIDNLLFNEEFKALSIASDTDNVEMEVL